MRSSNGCTEGFLSRACDLSIRRVQVRVGTAEVGGRRMWIGNRCRGRFFVSDVRLHTGRMGRVNT